MHIDHDGSTLGRVSISLGVASVMANSHLEPMSVVKLATKPAYQAKEGGRNRVAAPPDYESNSLPALRRQAARHNCRCSSRAFSGANASSPKSQAARRHSVSHALRFGRYRKTRLALEAARGRIGTFARRVARRSRAARRSGPRPRGTCRGDGTRRYEQTPSMDLVVTALRSNMRC